MSAPLSPFPEDPALLQHMLREAQAEITRLQMLIAVLLRSLKAELICFSRHQRRAQDAVTISLKQPLRAGVPASRTVTENLNLDLARADWFSPKLKTNARYRYC
jgi:hypothetical protein